MLGVSHVEVGMDSHGNQAQPLDHDAPATTIASMNQRQADVIKLLAHSTLLPTYVSDPILAGTLPPLDEIVDALLIHALDCEALVADDPTTTMNERRIARACATVAFLAALTI